MKKFASVFFFWLLVVLMYKTAMVRDVLTIPEGVLVPSLILPLVSLFLGSILLYFLSQKHFKTAVGLLYVSLSFWVAWVASSFSSNSDIDILGVVPHVFVYTLLPIWMVIFFYCLGTYIDDFVSKHTSQKDTILRVGYGFGAYLLLAIAVFRLFPVSDITYYLMLGITCIPVLAFCLQKRSCREKKDNIRLDLGSWFLVVCIVSYLCVALFDLLRPIPVGWDDIGAYINYAKHIATHQTIPTGSPTISSWMYFTSIGYFFGGIVEAIYFSILGLFLAFWGAGRLFYLCTKRLGVALFGVCMLMSIPMLQYLTFVDLKVDGAVFFFGVVVLLHLMQKFSWESINARVQYRELIVLGLLLGLLVTIKITNVYLIFAAVSTIIFAYVGISGVAAFVALIFLLLGLTDMSHLMFIDVRPTDILFLIFLGFLLLVLLFVLLTRNPRSSFSMLGMSLFTCMLGGFFSLLPTALSNTYETYAQDEQLSVESIIYGPSVGYEPEFSKIKKIGNGAKVKKTRNREQGTGEKHPSAWNDHLRCGFVNGNADFARYRSNDCGLFSYLNALGFNTFKTPHISRLINLGVWFILIILGSLALVRKSSTMERMLAFFCATILCIFWLLPRLIPDFFVQALFEPIFPYGYFIIFLALGLFFFLVRSVTNRRWMVIFFFVYCFFWLVGALLIPWYGILLVLGGILLGLKLYISIRQEKILASSIILVGAILICFYTGIHLLDTLRTAGFRSFKSQSTDYESSLKASFLPLFPAVKVLNLSHGVDASSLTPSEIMLPSEDRASNEKIYLAGTFLGYFLYDDIHRVFKDYLLILFEANVLHEDNEVFRERLSRLGARYLVVDTKISNIDTRGKLIQRYEKILWRLREAGIPLLSVDNICIRMAFELDDLERGEFEMLVGVNYGGDEKEAVKQRFCLEKLQASLELQALSDRLRRDLQYYKARRSALTETFRKKVNRTYFMIFELSSSS